MREKNPKSSLFMVISISIAVAYIIGFVTDTKIMAEETGDKLTETNNFNNGTGNATIPIHNNSSISDSSTLQNNTDSCPKDYFYDNDDGICRLKPSQQPDPQVSAALCPPGYFAASGGLCEPIPKDLDLNNTK